MNLKFKKTASIMYSMIENLGDVIPQFGIESPFMFILSIPKSEMTRLPCKGF